MRQYFESGIGENQSPMEWYVRKNLEDEPAFALQMVSLMFDESELEHFNFEDYYQVRKETFESEVGELPCDQIISVGIKGVDDSNVRLFVVAMYMEENETNIMHRVSRCVHAINYVNPRAFVLAMVFFHADESDTGLDRMQSPQMDGISSKNQMPLVPWADKFQCRILNLNRFKMSVQDVH